MRISNFTIWSILFSFFLTIIIAKYSIPYLRKFKLGQNIRDDGPQSHLSKAGTPTMGGIFFVIAIILTTFCLGNFSKEVFAVLIGMLGFTLIGFLDDFFKLVMKRSLGLTEIQKLIIQFIISIVVILFIEKVVGTDLRYQLIPFVKGAVNFGWIIYPILIFFIIKIFDYFISRFNSGTFNYKIKIIIFIIFYKFIIKFFKFFKNIL